MSGLLSWFPFYVDRFRASRRARRMEAEQVGVYLLLMCEQWEHGPIPDDDGELAFVGRAELSVVRGVLEACFDLTAAGWINGRLARVKVEQEAKLGRRKGAASKRWKGNADAMQEQSTGEEKRVEEKRSREETTNPTVGSRKRKKRAMPTYCAEFEELWKIHPRGPKAEAAREYATTVERGVAHDVMRRGLVAYVRQELRADFKGAHLFRWIRDERWEAYQTKASLPTQVLRPATEPKGEPEGEVVDPAQVAELLSKVKSSLFLHRDTSENTNPSEGHAA